MRDVCVCRGVPPVSRRAHRAPFAITSDGELLMNASELAHTADVESVVRAARKDKREVFIGVPLSPTELRFMLGRLANATDEAAARIVGERHRARGRSKRKK